MNKTHKELLDQISALHEKKASDYATDVDPYSNFRFAALLSEGFEHEVDRVFATLIGVKLARIQELTKNGRTPKNESLDDSFVDLTNYCAIWASYRRDRATAWGALDQQVADNDRIYQEAQKAEKLKKSLDAQRKVGKQVSPGAIPQAVDYLPYLNSASGLLAPGPVEHVLYPKGDGTCCVCGSKATDIAKRETCKCRPASQEYIYGVGSAI